MAEFQGFLTSLLLQMEEGCDYFRARKLQIEAFGALKLAKVMVQKQFHEQLQDMYQNFIYQSTEKIRQIEETTND